MSGYLLSFSMEARGPRRLFRYGGLIRRRQADIIFELAGELYFPTAQLQPHHMKVGGSFPFVKLDDAPKLYLRSLAPAHGGFSQKINTGDVSTEIFDPGRLRIKP
jgi:hypothetical protein